jgi:lactoylglutathione lyase
MDPRPQKQLEIDFPAAKIIVSGINALLYLSLMKKIYAVLLSITLSFWGNACLAQPPKAKLNHLAIFVVDLQQSLRFYTQIIGLDTIAEPFRDGKHAWLSIGANLQLHIIAGADKPKNYFKNQHTCFSVANISTFTQQLSNKKIAWEDKDGKVGAITTRVDGIHQIWLQDPDGYWVEINDAP